MSMTGKMFFNAAIFKYCVQPLNPKQFIIISILLTYLTQNDTFGNILCKMKSEILPDCFYKKYEIQLGELSNTSWTKCSIDLLRFKSKKNVGRRECRRFFRRGRPCNRRKKRRKKVTTVAPAASFWSVNFLTTKPKVIGEDIYYR